MKERTRVLSSIWEGAERLASLHNDRGRQGDSIGVCPQSLNQWSAMSMPLAIHHVERKPSMISLSSVSQLTSQRTTMHVHCREAWLPTMAALSTILILAGCGSMGSRSAENSGTDSTVTTSGMKQDIALRDKPQLLAGDRTVVGTVDAIQGEQIKVEYADSLQPRYLPLSVAKAKGMEFQPGDHIKMVFNEQHILVDFHPLGHKDDHHTIVIGSLTQPMQTGQEQAEIKTEYGEIQTYPLGRLIRSKMAAVPVGAPAVFLLDKTDHIVDVTFGDTSALEIVKGEYQQMSSSK